jgi:hypothetical protein
MNRRCFKLATRGVAVWLALLFIGACATAQSTQPATQPAPWAIDDPGQGTVTIINTPPCTARELSGIAWLGGDRYVAVSDKSRTLAQLTIVHDPKTGSIVGTPQVRDGTTLSGGTDLEGVAFDAATGSIYVSDEEGPAIREHSLSDGSLIKQLPVPEIYRALRPNLGFEALTIQPDGQALWAANEEALSCDGPRTRDRLDNNRTATIVRIQKLDLSGAPLGQWGYVTDGMQGSGWIALGGSGVPEMLALFDGSLLVIERAVGVTLALNIEFRVRVYLADFTGTTDTTALPSLADAPFTPVRKTLLWERMLPNANIEGIALGPQLPDGRYLLLLISDDGKFTLPGIKSVRAVPEHVVYPLLLRSVAK